MNNKPKISALVCIDPSRCLQKRIDNKTPLDILWDLKNQFKEQDNIKVTPCKCIFGCTYGPRVDIINHETKEKTLYGSINGTVNISVRGKVEMNKIPSDPNDLIIGPAINNDKGQLPWGE